MLGVAEGAAKTIAGEITLAADSPNSLRKWRGVFGLKQNELAERMSVSPSVISDYESGRRHCPGTHFVKRFVETLVEMDWERGGNVVRKFSAMPQNDAIISFRDFDKSVDCRRFVDIVEGEIIANNKHLKSRRLGGYTILDSIQAILSLNELDFRSIYGSDNQRALVFTKVSMGRSPMIAIKVTQPKPQMVVLHGLKPEDVDPLAKHIAERENIPLIVSGLKTQEELIERLGSGF
jgi:putative transcriptional regulator